MFYKINNYTLFFKTHQQSKEDSQTIYKTKKGEEDTWLLYFEQFVSGKEIEYFKEHFSMLICFILIFVYITHTLIYVKEHCFQKSTFSNFDFVSLNKYK